MTVPFGEWAFGLDGAAMPSRDLVGGKAWSLARLLELGLTAPPAFVVTTRACTAYMATGAFPKGLVDELAAGVAWLELRAGRSFGRGPRPLLVSVRSGAPVSMPGMMDTILNLGVNDTTEAALAAECGEPRFARDTHRRFLDLYVQIVLKQAPPTLAPDGDPAYWREQIARGAGASVPQDPMDQLRGAVAAVFESWNSRRARRYRQHHDIPDTLGTAVTVQAMAFGNADDASGTGVLFTRNPLTGEPAPYGEYLPRAQGEDVVSGKFTPKPLSILRESLPAAHEALLEAARTLERAARDVQDIEFTVERGRLYFLQTRSAKLAPQAAARIAVDMANEGLIDETTALGRVTPEQARLLLSPHLTENAIRQGRIAAQGEGASPGVGSGTIVCDCDEAERRAKAGEAVVLARATTSPEDLHGMIGARALVTEQGGASSHAAVVGRALGLPCVVGCGAGSLAGLAGEMVTVDGRTGKVYRGILETVTPDERANQVLAALAKWAAARSPLQVVSAMRAPETGIVDLAGDEAAADPARIAEALARHRGAKGARGGAIASPEGVRAAIAAGFAFIVADPVLPVLLQAIRSAAAATSAVVEKERV